MKLSDRLKDLSARTKEYCQFLEDELINLKGVGRSLEKLAAEQERLEKGGEMLSDGGISSPRKKRNPSNKCNFPFF